MDRFIPCQRKNETGKIMECPDPETLPEKELEWLKISNGLGRSDTKMTENHVKAVVKRS